MNIKMLLPILLLFTLSCLRNVQPTSEKIPARMSIINDNKTETVFYLTMPKHQRFPIAVLCAGSTTQDDVASVWGFHEFDQFRLLAEREAGAFLIILMLSTTSLKIRPQVLMAV
jgi:hypothetical protein